MSEVLPANQALRIWVQSVAALLPFCGYNMGDYFGHGLSLEKKLHRAPKIFPVN